MSTAAPTKFQFKLDTTESGGRDSVKHVRPQKVLTMNWGKGLVVLGTVRGEGMNFLLTQGLPSLLCLQECFRV